MKHLYTAFFTGTEAIGEKAFSMFQHAGRAEHEQRPRGEVKSCTCKKTLATGGRAGTHTGHTDSRTSHEHAR